ncbi:hypothetical protein [Methylobacterium sp. E-016]|nr:hypothetical protein [Methylobacterium sp. E-016]
MTSLDGSSGIDPSPSRPKAEATGFAAELRSVRDADGRGRIAAA